MQSIIIQSYLALTLAGAFSPGWRIIEERLEGTTMNPRDPKGSE